MLFKPLVLPLPVRSHFYAKVTFLAELQSMQLIGLFNARLARRDSVDLTLRLH